MREEITIIIDTPGGRLLWADLAKAIHQSTHALLAVGRTLADQDQLEGSWRVERLSMNSPVEASLAFEPTETSIEFIPEHWFSKFQEGLRQLEHREVQPDGFSENAIRAISNLSSLRDRVDGIAYVVDGTTVRTTAAAAAHAAVVDNRLKKSVAKHYDVEGEIRGVLGQITVHGSTREFVIYDDLTDERIACHFVTEDVSQVSAAITRRVSASGSIRYDRHHHPQSMKVEAWTLLPEPSELASLDRIRAAMRPLPEGTSSEEYVGGLRDDE